MIKPGYISSLFTTARCSLLITAISIGLYACPYSSQYKLDEEASIPVDENLLGKWATMVLNKYGKPQPIKMIISRKNDTEYFIDFTGDLSDLKPFRIVSQDTIKGSAYMSIVDDKQFLNIEVKDQNYISMITFKNNMLSIMPIADGFTAKYIKSDEQLRAALQFHCKTHAVPKTDEDFCLKDMVKVN